MISVRTVNLKPHSLVTNTGPATGSVGQNLTQLLLLKLFPFCSVCTKTELTAVLFRNGVARGCDFTGFSMSFTCVPSPSPLVKLTAWCRQVQCPNEPCPNPSSLMPSVQTILHIVMQNPELRPEESTIWCGLLWLVLGITIQCFCGVGQIICCAISVPKYSTGILMLKMCKPGLE